ncbi:MAG: recombination mediator RecR [Actinomycetota bacterium]|nr:MAG: recombination protein [Actinomycetota bacterium]MDO8949853.1 recombination mediator RecR [Actinomycetota bacterium]MDP3629435.1 recombination mediator RecR [Actinomycetota bacterium]
MSFYAAPIARLLEELERLPGIGPKSAQRLAFHILRADDAAATRLADAIVEVKRTIHFCARCFNLAEADLCEVCRDSRRDEHIVCVVEEPRDVVAIERTGEFHGLYHVLQGAISPIDGVGPEHLRVRELIDRIGASGIEELILATNPNVEGETTALYISRLAKPLGVRVTRIASGLPVGGDLEYADEVTLGRALEARREM